MTLGTALPLWEGGTDQARVGGRFPFPDLVAGPASPASSQGQLCPQAEKPESRQVSLLPTAGESQTS